MDQRDRGREQGVCLRDILSIRVALENEKRAEFASNCFPDLTSHSILNLPSHVIRKCEHANRA